MKTAVRIIKYSLYSLVLAVVFASIIIAVLYLQGTAVEITRPERTIEAEGAGRDLSFQLENSEESRQAVESSVSARAGSEQEKNFTLRGLESDLERLLQRRYEFMKVESEQMLARESRFSQRQYEQFRAEEQQEAEERIEQNEAALEEEIREIDSELTEQELEILQEVRREYRQENWPELLNLRVKLRTMDLSADRHREISERVAEIEADIEDRVELVRQQLESRLEQERLRSVGQLRQRHNIYVQNVLTGLEARLDSFRAELEEEKAELEAREQERREAARNQLEERLQRQFEIKSGHLHSLYDN